MDEIFKIIFNNRVRHDKLRPKDKIRFAVISSQLNSPIKTRYQDRREVNDQWMANFIADRLQSFEQLVVNQDFELSVQVVKRPSGHGITFPIRYGNAALAIDARVSSSRTIFSSIPQSLNDLPCF